MSSGFFSKKPFYVRLERDVYVFLAFVYAMFEAYSQTYILSTRLLFLGFCTALHNVCIGSLFAVAFYFSLTDGYRILTRNKMQLLKNLRYCLQTNKDQSYKQYITYSVLVAFFVGFLYLLPYHFAREYVTNYLAMSVHVSMSTIGYRYYLGYAVMPDLIINAVNIVHNALVSLRSVFEGMLSLHKTTRVKLVKAKSNDVVDSILFSLKLVLYTYSVWLAKVMSLANHKNYQDYMVHYLLISSLAFKPLRAGKSLYNLLYFRSLGNFIKLSEYIVSNTQYVCKNFRSKIDFRFLFTRQFFVVAFGHLACVLRAYSRAIRVSGYAPMLFTGCYHYLDKASSNPIATISMQLPASPANKLVGNKSRMPDVNEVRPSL